MSLSSYVPRIADAAADLQMSMLKIMGCGQDVVGLGLRRCQVNLRREFGVVWIGEESVVHTLGWRVVLVGIGFLEGGAREPGGRYFWVISWPVVGKSPGLLRLGKGGAIVTVEVIRERRERYDDDVGE